MSAMPWHLASSLVSNQEPAPRRIYGDAEDSSGEIKRRLSGRHRDPGSDPTEGHWSVPTRVSSHRYVILTD